MSFIYEKANDITEAIALHAAYPHLQIVAGGTDVIVAWRSGRMEVTGIVDISSVQDLNYIEIGSDYYEIGTLATAAQMCADSDVCKHFPLLTDACKQLGAVQIQNLATLGGNVMNASPAGDLIPSLLAYNAEVKLQNLYGTRMIPLQDFFTGYRQTAILPDELLIGIRLPLVDDSSVRMHYQKVGTRSAQAISKLAVALLAKSSCGGIQWIRIGLASVAAVPMRAFGTEKLIQSKVIGQPLIEQARASLMDEISPIDDIRSTAMYRKEVCANILEDFLWSVQRK